jgi:putative endonuclease
MDFIVYIIYSQKIDRYYIGYTEDIDNRLMQHNGGESVFTAKANDWNIVYKEVFLTSQETQRKERIIKAKKSRKYVEWLVARVGYISIN